MVYEEHWTSKRTLNQATTFSLVYEVETVVSVEIMVPSARLPLTSKIMDSQDRVYDVETIEEKRKSAEDRWMINQIRISRAYNKRVKPRVLKVGDLVLKAAGYIQKRTSASKFASKWEGPYHLRSL